SAECLALLLEPWGGGSREKAIIRPRRSRAGLFAHADARPCRYRPGPASCHSRFGVQQAHGGVGALLEGSGRPRPPCLGVGGVAESLADGGEGGRDPLGLFAVGL